MADSMNAKDIFEPTLFWDVRKIDLQRHAPYIIARVLDFGDENDLKILREIYPDTLLMEVIQKKKGLLPITRRFWSVYFGLSSKEET